MRRLSLHINDASGLETPPPAAIESAVHAALASGLADGGSFDSAELSALTIGPGVLSDAPNHNLTPRGAGVESELEPAGPASEFIEV